MIKVLGLTQFKAQLDVACQKRIQAIDAAVQNAGLVTEAGAKKRSPVRKGRLRAGNQYRRTGLAACRVANAVTYAKPVELGHVTRSGSVVAPRPFLFPGYLEGKAALKADLMKIPGLRIKTWS